jgi:subtilase family serine protease
MAVTTFVRKQVAVMAVAAMLALLVAPSAAAAGPGTGPSWSHQDVHVCSPTGTDQAACTSIARVLYANGLVYQAATPAQLQAAARAASSVSFTAANIRTAYGITGQGDPSKVIAIVDAYDDPNALSHLNTYRSYMGLHSISSCALSQLTSSPSSPCFTKVNQTGGTKLPSANSGWSNEIDLDLQAASAICPTCSLLLLEATSSTFSNLGTAVTTASNTAHVLAISNSYGTQGDVAQASYAAWNTAAQKGIAVMAAAGDWGYGTSFPASSTDVLGVGGTTLSIDSTGVRNGETAWSATGSGCSSYNLAPTWQFNTQGIISNPCGTMKAVADLSADADPNSGLQIYTTYSGRTSWWIFGGTSLSTPLMSALYAMQGGYGGSIWAGQYAWASTTPYFDVTTGFNGTCNPLVLCQAVSGWDGPTGLGSIAAVTAPPVLTTITVSPSSATVLTNGTLPFSATALDQNGNPLATQPATFTWSASGDGAISASGVFTAGTSAGSATVTASSGVVISSPASVTVTAPATSDFTLSASPSSRSIKRGQSTSYSISITRSNGFSDAISFSLSGQPSGATYAFSPNPTSTTGTSSTLSITNTSSAAPGTYTLTITGASASLTHTVAVTLKLR